MTTNPRKQKRRAMTSVEYSADDRKLIDAFASKYGGRGIKKQVLSLLIHWFAKQDEAVQQAVMGWTPGSMRPAYAAVLRAMADDIESGRSAIVGQATTIVRLADSVLQEFRGETPSHPEPEAKAAAGTRGKQARQSQRQ